MTICANCSKEAVYTYTVTPEYELQYCQSHLPKFLYAQRDAGLLPSAVVVEEVVPVVEEVVEPAKPSKKKDVVPEVEPEIEPEVLSDDASN
jgi:hypothetical protein